MDELEDVTTQDPRIAELIEQLHNLPLTIISGATFVGQNVHLDGRSFVRCTFRNCTLISRLGLFELSGPQTFEGRIIVTLGQPAQYAHEFFARMSGGNVRRTRERRVLN